MIAQTKVGQTPMCAWSYGMAKSENKSCMQRRCVITKSVIR